LGARGGEKPCALHVGCGAPVFAPGGFAYAGRG
jgi:hypothetical protein